MTDPVERWLYPSDDAYDEHFPAFVEAFGGGAFAHDTAWQVDDFAGVALWFPPDTSPDGEEVVRVLMTTTHPSRHPDTIAGLEQMDAAHPRFPHWYLPWLGVDAAFQGRGVGGILMTESLRAVDETSSAGVPGDAEPSHHPVLRAPRVPGDRRDPDRGVPAGHVHVERARVNVKPKTAPLVRGRLRVDLRVLRRRARPGRRRPRAGSP